MKKAIVFMFVLAVFVALGSVYKLSIVPYVVVASVITVTVLIAMGRISVGHYPVYIFGLALALIWQTSMLGTYIVGVDIHSEYLVVNRVIAHGWDWSWNNAGNSSVILTLLTPALAKLGFNPVWQFKTLYPFVCAFAPVVLYYAFRRMFGDKRAYFGVLFFMLMPMYTMEAVSMVKSQCAYLCFAGIVFMLTSTVRPWRRALGVGVLAIGTTVCHYTVGIVTLSFLVGILLVLASTNWWKLRGQLGERTLPVRYFAVAVVCAAIFFGVWFTNIGDGRMLGQVQSVFRGVVVDVRQIAITTATPQPEPQVEEPQTPKLYEPNLREPQTVEPRVHDPRTVEPEGTKTQDEAYAEMMVELITDYTKPVKHETYLDRQPPLVRAAIGLDFDLVSPWGKVFRILQYTTEVIFVVGLFVLLRRRKELKAEYVAGILGCFLLLICALFLPFFTVMTISTTRLYIATLFFISPLLVLGVEQTTILITKYGRKVR